MEVPSRLSQTIQIPNSTTDLTGKEECKNDIKQVNAKIETLSEPPYKESSIYFESSNQQEKVTPKSSPVFKMENQSDEILK